MKTAIQIVGAGMAAGVAFLGAQAVDLAITRNKVDDRVLLGRLAPGATPSQAVAIGAVMHVVNSVVFSAVFRLVIRDRLRGPMWLRGVTFALVENTLLYPLAIFEDFHPALRDGQMDSYQSGTAFAQETWRHVVLGAVLGALTPKNG
jgi:hypothetical protein